MVSRPASRIATLLETNRPSPDSIGVHSSLHPDLSYATRDRDDYCPLTMTDDEAATNTDEESGHADGESDTSEDETRSHEPGDATRSEHPETADLDSEDPWIEFEAEGEGPSVDFDEAFEDMSVDEVARDDLWSRLEAAGDSDIPTRLGEVARGESSGVAGVEPGRDVRIIRKRICENCKYFSDPPEVHCTHDGTEILELTDVDHHMVVDCPVVSGEESSIE